MCSTMPTPPTAVRTLRRLQHTLRGLPLVRGRGGGALLHADVPLSFWGGVSPESGEVIDVRHPLCGSSVTGKVLAIPNSRGSCTGSQVMLELLLSGTGPSAVLLREDDDIISLGAIVAEELFDVEPPPIVTLGASGFARAAKYAAARVESDGCVHLIGSIDDDDDEVSTLAVASTEYVDEAGERRASHAVAGEVQLELTDADVAMLDGEHGAATQAALRVVTRVARLQGARQLVDVTRAHIDSCIHVGHASVAFAERFVALGGRCAVPTTLNAVSVDLNQWRAQGVEEEAGRAASSVGEAYVSLGAVPSFTCAPYLLEGMSPRLGEHIGWSESNAVVYANACLGARTQKNADFLDACIALTGRAPLAGCHVDAGRTPTLELHVDTAHLRLGCLDDAFWGTLGYVAGLAAGARVPLITGLEEAPVGSDDLKALSAAFGTTSGSPLFHLHGHTPEAATAAHALLETAPSSGRATVAPAGRLVISVAQLERAYEELDRAGGGGGPPPRSTTPTGDDSGRVQLVALGNPHFSPTEIARLSDLIRTQLARGSHKSADVRLMITMGREVRAAAAAAGHLVDIESFGGELVCDTCWCMLREPVVPPAVRTLVTNSAKYAHYAPGLVGRRVRFASLERCVAAAVEGTVSDDRPGWLR